MTRKIYEIARDIKREWVGLNENMVAYEYLQEMLIMDNLENELYPPPLGANRETVARFLDASKIFRSPKDNPVASRLKNELREILGFKSGHNCR